MAETARGMGRGLGALFASTTTAEPHAELRDLPVELIRPNPHQPRRHFDDDGLAGLAASVGERGVLQPVLVRPVPGGTYELIAGERRWRAAALAGLDEVPALIQPHEDAESLELALIENMAREDLNPVEEARACALLVEELGLTREELGRRVGRSRVAVTNIMRLLDLPDEALELLEQARLTAGHGRAILIAVDHDARRRLARSAADEHWSVRHTEERARAANEPATPATPAAPVRAHPDHVEAAGRIGEALARAFGTEVRVTPRGDGYRVALTVASHEEALALADRLGAPAPA